MIRATPNAVRFDQVNKVNYRFQALHFQSDVLEALVSNSPPLQRRDRAASTPLKCENGKGGRVHSDGSGGKPDECGSPLFLRRSSFVESPASERRAKASSSSSPNIRRKCGMASTQEDSVVDACDPAEESINDSVVSQDAEDRHRASTEERVPLLDASDDVFGEEEDIEILEKKSKEELKSLVLTLQRELLESKRRESTTVKNGIKLQRCTTLASSPVGRYRHSKALGTVTRSLTSHVQDLENEVRRAQAVTARFQEELTSLKTRLDDVITHCQVMQKELVTNDSKETSSLLLLRTPDVDEDPSIKKLKEISGI